MSKAHIAADELGKLLSWCRKVGIAEVVYADAQKAYDEYVRESTTNA
jgi:hypothetical protein